MKRIGILFPGQASQYVGMGKEFTETYPECRSLVEAAEKVTGLNLMQLCQAGPIEALTRTLICQPAVFATSLVCWEALRQQLKTPPVAVAGHSLGEYTALAACGVFSLSDGFRIVARRAQAMDRVSSENTGTLLAVLGRSLHDVRQMAEHFPGVEISNINAPLQVVVGGTRSALEPFSAFLNESRVKAVWLKVSGPFHTNLMKNAVAPLTAELDTIAMNDPQSPVYMNTTGRRTTSKENVRQNLLRQVVTPVRWVECVQNMVNDGVDVFIEVGPGNVLKGLVQKIVPAVPVLNVENPATLAHTVRMLDAATQHETLPPGGTHAP